ncbi:MAG: M28 family peptidase [Acetobacteraceae bacterium]|nr:M28 family peptidase [Acetobacteraceae bacterium]
MTDQPFSALAAQTSGALLMDHCRAFARWVKLSGTRDEAESLRYVQARLDEYGYRTRVILHDAYISLPGKARVEVDGTALTAITHSMGRSSPADGVAAELVYVGHGTAADFAGKDVRGRIVVAEGIATPVVAALARDGGAVGQLHISPHHHLHEMCISPVWGNPDPHTFAQLPATVACTVSNADGSAIRDRLAAGHSPRVVLHAEVDTGWRKTPILEAELDAPGSASDAPFILFSGHHDTWYYGVMDNGSANATMLEVARLAATRRADWRRNLRICFWSGHSHGRYSGSAWYVDNHWDAFDRHCAAHVNVDSTGGIGATELGHAAAMSPLHALAAEAITEQTGLQYSGKRKNRSSDDSLPGLGVPSMFGGLSEQPPSKLKLRNALGWWWHTPEDLIDKVDEANLVRDTKVFVHVVAKLLTDAVLPLDFAAQAHTLREELAGLATALGPRFDLAPLQAATNTLHARAQRLGEAAGRLDPATVNATLMALSRALVPVDYASSDRFTHDPALPVPDWAVLQPLRDLAATTPGSDAAFLHQVSARRAANRLGDALRTANAALDAALGA